jgi:hypothetical protein
MIRDLGGRSTPILKYKEAVVSEQVLANAAEGLASMREQGRRRREQPAAGSYQAFLAELVGLGADGGEIRG